MSFYRTASPCLGKYYIHAASFSVVLGDFGYYVTCKACPENSRAIALGSKPPLVTRIARTGLGPTAWAWAPRPEPHGREGVWVSRFSAGLKYLAKNNYNSQYMLNKFAKNSLRPCTLNFKIAIIVEICRLITVLVPYYHWVARWGNAHSRNTYEPP